MMKTDRESTLEMLIRKWKRSCKHHLRTKGCNLKATLFRVMLTQNSQEEIPVVPNEETSERKKLVTSWRQFLPTYTYGNSTFPDLRPFWKSLSKIEVVSDWVDRYKIDEQEIKDPVKCIITFNVFNREMAFISRKEKCVNGKVALKRDFDGRFDFRVKNCTFARIVSEEQVPVSIDFIEKGGFFELDGCTVDSPWFHPVLGVKFHIETDGEEVEYKAFSCRSDVQNLISQLDFDSPFFPCFLNSKTVLMNITGVQSVVLDSPN